MGETLAMSNIAGKFITAGFLPEAQQECENALKENALKKDRYHDNIVTTLARLKSIPDNENEKEVNLLKNIKPTSEFYVKAGRAMSQPNLQKISKYWRGPDCVLGGHARLRVYSVGFL
jgi:DNA replication protein DnaD